MELGRGVAGGARRIERRHLACRCALGVVLHHALASVERVHEGGALAERLREHIERGAVEQVPCLVRERAPRGAGVQHGNEGGGGECCAFRVRRGVDDDQGETFFTGALDRAGEILTGG